MSITPVTTAGAALVPQQTLPGVPLPGAMIGPNVLLMAPSGNGKTHAARSLVEQGLEVFVLATEPGIESVLGDLPKDKLHWHYLPPIPMTLDMLEKQAKEINTMSFEQLTKVGGPRTEFRQTLDLIALTKDFVCQRTGQHFGPITQWNSQRAFVFDGLSGLTLMSVNSFVGTRVALGPADYGVCQKQIEAVINAFCMTLKCWFVMTAHVERETDEVSQSVELMVSTLGKKLAPKLPRYFDEVIYLKREGPVFSWSNMERQVTTKKRMLPLSDKLDPSFNLLMREWKKRTGQ